MADDAQEAGKPPEEPRRGVMVPPVEPNAADGPWSVVLNIDTSREVYRNGSWAHLAGREIANEVRALHGLPPVEPPPEFRYVEALITDDGGFPLVVTGMDRAGRWRWVGLDAEGNVASLSPAHASRDRAKQAFSAWYVRLWEVDEI